MTAAWMMQSVQSAPISGGWMMMKETLTARGARSAAEEEHHQGMVRQRRLSPIAPARMSANRRRREAGIGDRKALGNPGRHDRLAAVADGCLARPEERVPQPFDIAI